MIFRVESHSIDSDDSTPTCRFERHHSINALVSCWSRGLAERVRAQQSQIRHHQSLSQSALEPPVQGSPRSTAAKPPTPVPASHDISTVWSSWDFESPIWFSSVLQHAQQGVWKQLSRSGNGNQQGHTREQLTKDCCPPIIENGHSVWCQRQHQARAKKQLNYVTHRFTKKALRSWWTSML